MTTLESYGQVLSCKALQEVVRKRQARGEVVVWTNGCFDILHAGHVLLLEQARAFGDCLVVGLNADASVRRLKGPDRPINPARYRGRVLAALRCVDYVVVFRGNSPLRVIERLKPNIYAKGGDYTVDTVNQAERRLVEGYGGRVRTVGEIKGLSTTSLIERSRHGGA
ncbi:MAG: D-glycero-beta-D-manno-heptose 1-phosphate adenylyltransferase [Planctomycetota bacterium]|jgi:D-beta-D-heptose 7-phosphate kinase/D-beta-D-heptose 1-phosphate adenosyltransferase